MKKQIGEQEESGITVCYIINYDKDNKVQNDFVLESTLFSSTQDMKGTITFMIPSAII